VGDCGSTEISCGNNRSSKGGGSENFPSTQGIEISRKHHFFLHRLEFEDHFLRDQNTAAHTAKAVRAVWLHKIAKPPHIPAPGFATLAWLKGRLHSTVRVTLHFVDRLIVPMWRASNDSRTYPPPGGNGRERNNTSPSCSFIRTGRVDYPSFPQERCERLNRWGTKDCRHRNLPPGDLLYPRNKANSKQRCPPTSKKRSRIPNSARPKTSFPISSSPGFDLRVQTGVQTLRIDAAETLFFVSLFLCLCLSLLLFARLSLGGPLVPADW